MDKDKIKEYLEPLKDGFLGKQRTSHYKRPVFEDRKLGDMLKVLVEIPMEEFAYYAFSREPLNGKFTDEERMQYTREAIECGSFYAKKVMEECESRDPEVIAKKLGMAVSYPSLPEKTDRVLFAEYREPNQIKIYMDAVRKGERSLQDEEAAELLGRNFNIANVLLAHELFHFVEDKYAAEIYTRTKKIRLWHIGPIHNDSTIITLGEIAAMAFSSEINRLSFSPYVMDVFLVYGYSPQEASGLYEEILRLRQKSDI